MPLLDVGQQVGRWKVVRFIDAGGNGEVWEVADSHGQSAAMKMLLDRRADSVAYKRFKREIETLQGLEDRPNVLKIVDSNLPPQPTRSNRAWYVMPLATPLVDALSGRPVEDVIDAVAELAEALADLHASGIGHRDIKPANLLWHDGRPVLGDFGLVWLPDAEALTEPGRVPGALGYISDEMMQSPTTAAAPAADVFALAKVLWKLLIPGGLFPPQGALRADGGPSSLARGLTVSHADSLDRITERATRAVSTRSDMATFAHELRMWLTLAPGASAPPGLGEAIALARESMNESLNRRDAATARSTARDAAEDLLAERAGELFDLVRAIDPSGTEIGRMAIGRLNQLIEQPAEMGGIAFGPPFHCGARVTRPNASGRDDVLVLAFCLEVSEQEPATGAVAGLLLAGDENSNDSTSVLLEPRRAPLGVDLEIAIEQAVVEAGTKLSGVVSYFADRAAG